MMHWWKRRRLEKQYEDDLRELVRTVDVWNEQKARLAKRYGVEAMDGLILLLPYDGAPFHRPVLLEQWVAQIERLAAVQRHMKAQVDVLRHVEQTEQWSDRAERIVTTPSLVKFPSRFVWKESGWSG